jgi:hypothetical protein
LVEVYFDLVEYPNVNLGAQDFPSVKDEGVITTDQGRAAGPELVRPFGGGHVRGIASGEVGDVVIVERDVDTAQGTGGQHARTMQDQLRTAA